MRRHRTPSRPRAALAVAAVLATVAFGLGSCSLFDGGDTPGVLPSTSQTTPTIATGPAEVRLLSAGALPRKELRYRFQPAMTTRLDLSVHVTVDQKGGTTTQTATPTLIMTMELAITDVVGDEAGFTFTYAGGRVAQPDAVDAPVLAQLQESLARLHGITGTGRMNDRGQVRTFAFAHLDRLDAQLRQTVETMQDQMGAIVAPLPTEPVGVGARWTVTATPLVLGVALPTTTTVTLSARDGDVVSYRSEAVSKAQDAKIPGDALGAGTSGRFVAITTTADTTGDFDLASMTAHAIVRSTSEQILEVTRSGRRRTVNQTATMDLTVGPAS